MISSIRKRLVAQTGIEAIKPSEAPCAGKSKATTRKPAPTRTGKRKAKSSGCPSQPCTSSTAGPVPTSTAETFPRGPASQNLLPLGSEIVELLRGRRAGVKNARAARAAGRGSADLIWFPLDPNGRTVRAQPESSTAESGRREGKVLVPVRTLIEARFTGNNHFWISAHSHRLIRRKIRIEGSPRLLLTFGRCFPS